MKALHLWRGMSSMAELQVGKADMTAIRKRVDRFTETDIDEEIVIMRLSNGEFFSLSETSASVWRLIDGRRDRQALIAALSEEFDSEPGQIASDVDDLLRQLQDAELLAED